MTEPSKPRRRRRVTRELRPCCGAVDEITGRGGSLCLHAVWQLKRPGWPAYCLLCGAALIFDERLRLRLPIAGELTAEQEASERAKRQEYAAVVAVAYPPDDPKH